MSNILNVAHRGFTRAFPDNTLEAFAAAIEIGVDGIECDVRETADHEFIMFHDPELLGQEIAEMSLAQVDRIILQDRFRIPTLTETLDLCREQAKLLVELKCTWSLDRLSAILNTGAKPENLILISFHRELMLDLSRLLPEIPRAILTDHPISDPLEILGPSQSLTLIVRYPFATEELVERIRARHLSIIVWGCADLKEIRSTLKLGVDGIISDFPDLVSKEISTGLALR